MSLVVTMEVVACSPRVRHSRVRGCREDLVGVGHAILHSPLGRGGPFSHARQPQVGHGDVFLISVTIKYHSSCYFNIRSYSALNLLETHQRHLEIFHKQLALLTWRASTPSYSLFIQSCSYMVRPQPFCCVKNQLKNLAGS